MRLDFATRDLRIAIISQIGVSAESNYRLGAARMFGYRTQAYKFGPKWSTAATIFGCVVGWALPAAAYLPFDGTDAAVADVGEVEIELQPAGLFRENSQTKLIAPFAVYNYGFVER